MECTYTSTKTSRLILDYRPSQVDPLVLLLLIQAAEEITATTVITVTGVTAITAVVAKS